MKAIQCQWTVTDILINPSTEKFIIYSTHTGILHIISNYYLFYWDNDYQFKTIELSDQYEDEVVQTQINLLSGVLRDNEESNCPLMKNNGVFSMCMFPNAENEIWCC